MKQIGSVFAALISSTLSKLGFLELLPASATILSMSPLTSPPFAETILSFLLLDLASVEEEPAPRCPATVHGKHLTNAIHLPWRQEPAESHKS
jgi:hypothetical protein